MVSHEQVTKNLPTESSKLALGEVAVHEGVRSELQLLMNGLAAIHSQRACEAKEGHADDVKLIESRGYAALAPTFESQVHDSARTKTHSFIRRDSAFRNHDEIREDKDSIAMVATEQEGLRELYSFLSDFIEKEESVEDAPPLEYLIHRAQNIRDGLTFLGRPELEIATETIGVLWKSYLDADPENQLCVLTKITGANLRGERRKSDEYIRDAILDTFSDQELEQYSGRIVTELYELRGEPEKTRIVMVDDWTISGSQVRDELGDMSSDRRFAKYKDSLEINLLVGDRRRINSGFTVSLPKSGEVTVPVKACYLAHDVTGVVEEDITSIISGEHSSVDFDFEDPLTKIVERNKQVRPEDAQGSVMPSLTNIIRSYRKKESQYRVGNGRVERVHA